MLRKGLLSAASGDYCGPRENCSTIRKVTGQGNPDTSSAEFSPRVFKSSRVFDSNHTVQYRPPESHILNGLSQKTPAAMFWSSCSSPSHITNESNSQTAIFGERGNGCASQHFGL